MLQRYYFKHMISYMSLLQNRTPSEASSTYVLVTAPSRMQLAAGATHDEWARWWWCVADHHRIKAGLLLGQLVAASHARHDEQEQKGNKLVAT
jgi:hypothetical protein